MNASLAQPASPGKKRAHTAGTNRAERILLIFFLLSLPLLNPWVRGDGVGYYAFARAPLIEHSLDFTQDYLHANESFRGPRVDENGQPRESFLTPTGHLDNHFTVGPAMLWTPFLLVAHAGVLLARALGSSVAADGFSVPYRLAMALGTAFCGFFGLLISFRLARRYVQERWAFMATLGIWGASSLPVYMYFNPSWSHAHSAFCVALFLWYFHETIGHKTLRQWLVLGLIAGLMLNVYYANALVLAALGVEAIGQYAAMVRKPHRDLRGTLRLACEHLFFGAVIVAGMLPTFLTRHIIYGSAFESGYTPLKDWLWRTPALLPTLFSADHGAFAWTPILLLATVGLFLFARRQPRIGVPLLSAALALCLFIACYPDWDGLSSFGNRFFVSLTALFVLGLAVTLDRLGALFRSERFALGMASLVLFLLIAWNGGFMFQWGTHLVPARGAISWPEMIRNQFVVVPRQITHDFRTYLFRRSAMMKKIEEKDLEQLEQGPTR